MKTRSIRKRLLCLAVAASFASTKSIAAPVAGAMDGFPVPTAYDIHKMVLNGYILDSEIEEVLITLSDLQVMPEHDNPTSATVDYLNDPSKIKRYNLLPRFSPIQTGQAASLSVASSAMEVVDAAADIVEMISGPIIATLALLNKEINATRDKLFVVQECQAKPGDADLCIKKEVDLTTKKLIDIDVSNLDTVQLAQLKTILTERITNMEEEIEEIEESLASQTPNFGLATTRFLANEVRLKYAQVGYTATAAEVNLIENGNHTDIITGVSSMLSNVINLGTFGILGVNYRAGFTDKEMRFLNAFRAVRPDIQVRPITGVTTRVIPTQSSIYKGSATDVGAGLERQTSVSPLADEADVSSNVILLGANIGSDGVCGGSTSCAVSLEYTFHGATMEANTKFGATLPPIVFASDFDIAVPEFEGTLNCSLEMGWQARGSSGVNASKGGLFRKSSMSVYNNVKHDQTNEGKCVSNIIKGSKDSAEWHLLKELESKLDDELAELLTPANDDMLAHKQMIENNLQAQQGNAAAMTKTGFGSFGIASWRVVLGGGWVSTVANVVTFGFGGGGYRYHRYDDSHVMNTVNINKTVAIGPDVVERSRITFDANMLLCWKVVDESTTRLEACSWEDVSDATNSPNQAVENCEDEWGALIGSTACTIVGEGSAIPVDNDADGTQDDPTIEDDDDTDIIIPPIGGWDGF